MDDSGEASRLKTEMFGGWDRGGRLNLYKLKKKGKRKREKD